MTEPQPIDVYEIRAEEQRHQLHESVEDLKDALRQRLDVKANARQYMAPTAGILALLGLAAGYAVAGLFSSGKVRRDYGRWMDLE
jgi:hypothetical protein